MPAVGVVASLALSSVGVTAASVGTAVLGAAGITASTTVASIVGGGIIGAGTGALTAAATGGDIGKGALGGLVSGGVSAGVSGALSQALSPGISNIDLQGANYAPPTDAVSRGLVSGGSRFAGSVAGGLATGQPIGQALKGGLISGLAGGLGTGIGTAADLGDTGSSILSGALGLGLSQAFQPSGRAVSIAGAAQPSAPATQYNLGSVTPGAQVGGLGGALFAAPGFGYSPGSPVFGSSDAEKTPAKNAWGGENKSLRDVGETVT